MANNRNVYQQGHTVSIPRVNLLDVAGNDMLGKKDLRVLLVLFTQLDGWSAPKSGTFKDPDNFKKIDVDAIADKLDMKKKEVKTCIKNLEDMFLIESGSSETITNGYRFTF